ncbi:MAG: hypothetical protein KDI98_05180 [Hyphomicrobiaceae bacterium]|nr:hypothetical protein [Hyphomicrobiaceae bacterium]
MLITSTVFVIAIVVIFGTLGLFGIFALPSWIEDIRLRRRRSGQEARELADPPWVRPRRIESSLRRPYDLLLERLELVEDRSAQSPNDFLKFYRDRETGQLWVNFFFEPGFTQMYVLSPIREIPPPKDQEPKAKP